MIQGNAGATLALYLRDEQIMPAQRSRPTVSAASMLPNELWMSCMENLDASSAAAARAVNKNFASLIDTVHPELLVPKASRVYQSRPKQADARAVESIVGRARTLTFRASPCHKLITIAKPRNEDRCSEPERIWQMIAWAPQLTELTIAHADALSDLGDITPPPRLPSSLRYLCLEGAHGSMLHAQIYNEMFSGKLTQLQSLHLEGVHLVDVCVGAAIRNISLFAQLTSLELHASFWGTDFVEVLLASNMTSLQNLAFRGVCDHGEANGAETQAPLLQFINKSRATLHRLVIDVQPTFERNEVTRWLGQKEWPNIKNLKICGLRLDTWELNLFDDNIFPALSRLSLPGTPASQERYRLLGQVQHRRWEHVCLGQDDWIDMTQRNHASWLAEPAFVHYRALRLRLSIVDARTAQRMIEKLSGHLMSLSLTGLDIHTRGIASLAAFFRHAHLPHLRELEITTDFLQVPHARQVYAEAPFDVWVENWGEDGMHGFYL